MAKVYIWNAMKLVWTMKIGFGTWLFTSYMLDNNYPMTAELAYQMDAPNLGDEIIDFLLSHSPQL